MFNVAKVYVVVAHRLHYRGGDSSPSSDVDSDVADTDSEDDDGPDIEFLTLDKASAELFAENIDRRALMCNVRECNVQSLQPIGDPAAIRKLYVASDYIQTREYCSKTLRLLGVYADKRTFRVSAHHMVSPRKFQFDENTGLWSEAQESARHSDRMDESSW